MCCMYVWGMTDWVEIVAWKGSLIVERKNYDDDDDVDVEGRRQTQRLTLLPARRRRYGNEKGDRKWVPTYSRPEVKLEAIHWWATLQGIWVGRDDLEEV